MPFLVPAATSLACDVLVVWLRRLAPDKAVTDDDEEPRQFYQSGYLAPLALTRIVILILPLLFHSYNGTALKCARLYQILYWGTLITLVVHMLALCLMDPQSLTAIFPTVTTAYSIQQGRRFLLKHLHELRRIWWMLLLSLVSDVCHLVLFWHVRSTAPLTLLLNDRKLPSVYFALRSASIGAVNESYIGRRPGAETTTTMAAGGGDDNGGGGEPALVHAMNDFMVDLQGRLQRAKQEWTVRLDDFTHGLTTNERRGRSSAMHNPLAPLTSFRVLLQLFAYEDVLENGRLDLVFNADDGESLTCYVPQLLSFLLHGALWCSPQLEDWVLDKCQQNAHFAHRCYWFLRAWCLEVPVQIPLAPAISRQNSKDALAPFLDEPVSPQHVTECGRVMRPSLSASASRPDKFFPEERVMIERFMLRVKECGEVPARVLEHGSGGENDDDMNIVSDLVERAGGSGVDLGNSPSELMSAIESGSIPVDPATGYPSLRHVDSVSSQRKFGFVPLDQDGSRLSSGDHFARGHGETEHFDKTPRFVDALIFLADSLFEVPRENRKDELQRQLRALECELLPSNAVYMPIGNGNHRVWRIVADESIAISTKERVPCIVYLEVLDYDVKRRHAKSWSLLPRKVQRSASSDTVPEPVPLVSATSSHSVSSSEYTLPEAAAADQSEAAVIHHWRTAYREPTRRVSLFDKVTTTVRDKVKVPLDHMKEKVREGLNQLRDRSVSEELQALTLAETLVDGTARKEARDGTELLASYNLDVESGRLGEDDLLGSGDGNLSRISSVGSLASMGQWSSPEQAKRAHQNSYRASSNTVLADARRRLQRERAEGSSGSLVYGSDNEEERKEEALVPSQPAGDSSTSQGNGVKKTKRPPVVFSESFLSKQERIRKRSAYGSNRSWRLMPIMIKANDDLRQEQLASQIIYRMSSILARERVPVWLYPYEIIAVTDRGGIIEAIPDTISLDSLKRNDRNYTGLRNFFHSHFGEGTVDLADAKANFVESLAAYSMVCFLLQIKDRHNGNILLDARGHLVHIDFGFFFLSSPGKNAGFESAPFKLTRDFVEVLGGPDSHLFRTFRDLCVKTFITLRRHCMEIILLVEMLKNGNEELQCFCGRPDDAIKELRDRFRLDLNDRACTEYVYSLVDNSTENWRTDWYDRYQRYFVGVL